MGYLQIITAIIIWSSLGIFVRKSGLSTTGIIFYPAVIAALCQLILLSMKGQIRSAVKTGNSAKSFFLLMLVPICFLANMYLFYFAFTHTSIANAVLTHYTAPIFVALIAPVFLKEKILKTTWLAILISSVGLWFITASGDGISLGESEGRGIIAGVLSGVAYAVLIIVVRWIASKYSALFIVFVQNVLVAMILLPFVLKMPFTLQSLPYVITMGVVHSTFAPLLYVHGFKSVKASEAAVLGYLEPVGAIILALVILYEVPGLKVLLGGSLILYSGYVILRGRMV